MVTLQWTQTPKFQEADVKASFAYGCFSIIMPLAFQTGLQMSSQHRLFVISWSVGEKVCSLLLPELIPALILHQKRTQD